MFPVITSLDDLDYALLMILFLFLLRTASYLLFSTYRADVKLVPAFAATTCMPPFWLHWRELIRSQTRGFSVVAAKTLTPLLQLF